ncbi:MAG: TonB-dependent receptor [Alphaproteobacteria bacterium]|nr:TonB-dependent receptor [Alphaproteobacteria bacterium]
MARAQEVVTFEIPPQSLESALVRFALQANVSLSLPPNGLQSIKSEGLSGARTPESALTGLLSGTGYAFERVGQGGYRIFPKTTKAARPARPTSPSQAPDVIIVSAKAPSFESDLPRDVTHLEIDQTTAAGITSDSGLSGSISGLSFTNLGEGRNKILLRGLSDGALTGRTQSLVGLYFNDTRITYGAPDPDLQLVDIASVEVLRGPQGALYGAGALGGIMRIDANQVDLDHFNGSMLVSSEATNGGDTGTNGEAVLNAPLVRGRLGVRTVFYNQSWGGWLDNPKLGTSNTNAAGRNGARLAALLKISNSWSVELTGVTQGITSKDSQYLSETPSGLQRTAAMPEPHDNDFGMIGLTLRGKTDWGDLTSTTSYVKHQFGSRFDASGAFDQFGAPPDTVQPIDEQDSLGILVHETRLSSPASASLPWFFGFFYADGDSNRDVALRDGDYGVWDSLDYLESRRDAVDELALFGQATWSLTPQISLSTGLRLFRSTLSMHSTTSEPLLGSQKATADHLTSRGIAPDIRLSFQPSHAFLLYLSAASGYRAGGFNTGGPIDQPFSASSQPFQRYLDDEIWTYEIGARLTLMDDRLALRATVFESDWRGVQTDALVVNGFPYSGNVGNAQATGLEFEVKYEPTPDLALQAHGLINEPDISHVSASFPQAITGGLPGSPEYSGGALIQYSKYLQFGSVQSRAFMELGGDYVGESTLGFGVGPPIGDYITVRARLGLTVQSWQATLYVDNLTNSDGKTYSAGNPYQPQQTLVTPLRPRTVGISLRKSF